MYAFQASLLQLPIMIGLDARHLLFWTTVILLWAGSLGFPSLVIASNNGNKGSIITHPSEEKTVVIAYHKPPNVITSHSDAEALAAAKSGTRRTVYEDIETLEGWVGRTSTTTNESWESITGIHSKLHAIGRLDCDTTGLLLLTNDGGLVHHVTNPTTKETSMKAITKTYQAVIMGHYENDHPSLETMRSKGVDIGAKYGGMTQPAMNLKVLNHPTAKSTLISITIGEGKNRQVRRMFHSIGSGVMKLKRTHIGDHLNLDGLDMGQWRILSNREVQEALDWKVRKIEDKPRKVNGKGRKLGEGKTRRSAGSSNAKKQRNRRRR